MPTRFLAVRDSFRGPLTWKTWTGLVALALLVAGLLTWAFWNPLGSGGSGTAAVVNDDEPVTIDGQIVPLGRQLAGDLTSTTDSAYSWVLTDAEDAEDGLADGTYAVVVTIPENFSARATSTTGPADQASQATIDIRTSANAGLVDPRASTEVAQATLRALNQEVAQTYLENIYLGFNTFHESISKAADGAGELADGTGALSAGARQLAGGSAQLADGLGALDAGAGQLAGGAADLSTGAGQLATGAGQLADGLTTAEQQTAQLPGAVRQLADGARQVADGNAQLAGVVTPIADRIIEAVDALPSTSTVTSEIEKLAAACPELSAAASAGEPDGAPAGGPSDAELAAFCAQLRDASQKISTNGAAIDRARGTVRDYATEAKTSIQQLASGADQVADGAEQLADGSQALADGIAGAASGARELSTGLNQLAGGARDLNTGTQQVATGAGEAASAGRQLADGAHQSADGAEQLNGGARDLATGLDEGRDQIPTYTDAERENLARTASTPAIADLTGSPDFGNALAAFLLALALWTCALATYVVIKPLPEDLVTSREPTWKTVIRAAAPGAAVAAVVATVVCAALAPFLDLSFGKFVLLLLVALLAALAFTAVNQAAAALFGRSGRLASIVVLVLTLAGSIVSTVPTIFTTLLPYLPTHGALQALRALTAGGDGLVPGTVALLAWLAAGTAATIFVTDRKRSLPARELRVADARPPVAA